MAPIQASTASASASRAGAVVELDRAADEDAARVQLGAGVAHPVLEQGAHPRQPARLAHGGREDLGLEAAVVLAHHGDLQLLARAEVGEHARLALAHGLGQGADGQALQPHARGHAQGNGHDLGARLLALGQRAASRRRGRPNGEEAGSKWS
jgi:hypothetical protein